MDPLDERSGRLLPRYPAKGRGPAVGWGDDGARDEVRFQPARLIDLSLAGALVEVPDGAGYEVGDLVTIRIGDVTGLVMIRHVQAPHDGIPTRYGVRFAPRQELQRLVFDAVEELREHTDRVELDWERAA